MKTETAGILDVPGSTLIVAGVQMNVLSRPTAHA
jgi:hypothetical protein